MRITLPLVVLACGLAACADNPVSAPARAPRLSVAAGQRVPLRIESWLHRQIGGNPLVTGTITSCAKVWIGDDLVLSGVPTWNDVNYALLPANPAAGAAAAAAKCETGTWGDVGGYQMAGLGRFQDDNLVRLDNILWARHNIKFANGSIDIQFEGKYNPSFLLTACNWVIKGGTGDFAGLQGNGDCSAQGFALAATDWADPSTWDIYFVHTETGTVHWTGNGK